MFKKKESKGQNVIEYLLIIAVLAAGIVIAGTALKNYITTKAVPLVYENELLNTYYTVKGPS